MKTNITTVISNKWKRVNDIQNNFFGVDEKKTKIG